MLVGEIDKFMVCFDTGSDLNDSIITHQHSDSFQILDLRNGVNFNPTPNMIGGNHVFFE